MHIYVQMNTISLCMGLRHAHFCTDDFHILLGFSSCTSLYEWLSILFLYGFSSCTYLYEWLSIFLWVFVMHIFVRMTIHFLVYGFSSCTFLYEWLSILFLYGVSSCTFCTNDYQFLVVWVFVMQISVRMTFHIFLGFSMCAMLFNAWIAWCSD